MAIHSPRRQERTGRQYLNVPPLFVNTCERKRNQTVAGSTVMGEFTPVNAVGGPLPDLVGVDKLERRPLVSDHLVAFSSIGFRRSEAGSSGPTESGGLMAEPMRTKLTGTAGSRWADAQTSGFAEHQPKEKGRCQSNTNGPDFAPLPTSSPSKQSVGLRPAPESLPCGLILEDVLVVLDGRLMV